MFEFPRRKGLVVTQTFNRRPRTAATTMVASLSPAKIGWSKVDNPDLIFQRFPSRRSVVYGTKGVVSSSNPLATEAGLEILRQGGNAGTGKTPMLVQFGVLY